MHKPEPQSVPVAAASSSSSVPSSDALKAMIPLLQKIKQDAPLFEVLIRLLKEMVSSSYNPAQKYQLMFKAIEIGNLFEILCSDIKEPKTNRYGYNL